MPEQSAVQFTNPAGETGCFQGIPGAITAPGKTGLTGAKAPSLFSRSTPASPPWPDAALDLAKAPAPAPGPSPLPPKKTFLNRMRESYSTALKAISDFSNPAYHYRKVKQDLAALNLARKVMYRDVRNDPKEFSKMLYGRMTACAGFSEAIDIVSPVLGLVVQVATGNPWIGLGVSWVAGYALCVAAFQGAWFLVNRDLYGSNYPSLWKQVVEMEKDVWPMHKQAARVAIPLFSVTTALNGAAIQSAVMSVGKEATRLIPFGPVLAGVKFVMSQMIFLRAMGNFNKDYAENLVGKYCAPAPKVELLSKAPVEEKWTQAANESRCRELVDILGDGGTVEVNHVLDGHHRIFHISLDSTPVENVEDERARDVLLHLRDSMIDTARIDDAQMPFTMKIKIPKVEQPPYQR